MSITNDDIKKSLEIAKQQNQELKNKIDSDSSPLEIINEINNNLKIKESLNSDELKDSLNDLFN